MFNLLGENLTIDIPRSLNKSELIYTQEFEASSKSVSTITLQEMDQPFLSYVVVQVHVFYFNVTLSLEMDFSSPYRQNGTNLGFVLTPGNSSRTIYLLNDNYDDIQFMVAVVVYNETAPIVGGCSTEVIPQPQVFVVEKEYFLAVHTPKAAASELFNCDDNVSDSLQYFTYYLYLEPMNFHHEEYFNAIKALLFGKAPGKAHQVGIKFHDFSDDSYDYISLKAKQVYSSQEKYFEKTPGTGIVFNSVVVDADGQQAFYVPSVTYSCPANTWNDLCSDNDNSKRALCVLLVIYSVVMIVNMTMSEVVESAMNGMLIGSFLIFITIKIREPTMSNLDVFMKTIFGSVLSSVIFGTFALYFRIGRYLTKLTFSNLMMALLMEIFFETVTSISLQFGGAFIMSISFIFIRISFTLLLGGLLLITSLSHLLKIGNIHRVFVNNFHALTLLYPPKASEESIWSLLRINFINYRINLSILDWSFIMIYLIGATILTIRKEIYFLENPDAINMRNHNTDQFNRDVAKNRCQNCKVGIKSNGRLKLVSRCRRHHYRSNVIHERSPLISHWIETDETEDEVFESPNSNSRFLQTLSVESRERLEAIQKFEEMD